MDKLKHLQPKRVFYYFEQISAIPRGSKNMKAISDYCRDFAIQHNLRYIKDDYNNVIIFKPGSNGYENSQPVILQGHLDMVCQKTPDSTIDFEKDGIDLYVDNDFIKAHNTTLGADNGIAVAIILAILENDEYSHPPIEAIFTVDEEIGMIGALNLDMSCLKSRKMINIDSEEEGVVTVSCAGGTDFFVYAPIVRKKEKGTLLTLVIKGLCGGHSGVEINRGRVNSDLLMGRALDHLNRYTDFDIISINGGDKSNAIPNFCTAELCVYDVDLFYSKATEYLNIVKKEIEFREKDFCFEITKNKYGEFDVFEETLKEKLILSLLCVPNGVINMSAEIDGLVETSLNLGILKTNENELEFCFSLRSNKKTAQDFLSRRLEVFFENLSWKCETSGYYPPWELNTNSDLQKIYLQAYKQKCGKEPEIAAIHAGLECGVFSAAIDNADCISVGPEMHNVHTTKEELSISSVGRFFDVLIEVLKKMK